MLYPKNLSVVGYCKKLGSQYMNEYSTLTKEIIEKSIGYVVRRIRLLLDENSGETFGKTLQYLLNVGKFTEEEYKIALKDIKPCEGAHFLFWIFQKTSENVSLIWNDLKFSIPTKSQDQYLEFIKKVVLQCTQELAITNQPKPPQNKVIIFSVDFDSSLSIQKAGSKDKLEEEKEPEHTKKTQYFQEC